MPDGVVFRILVQTLQFDVACLIHERDCPQAPHLQPFPQPHSVVIADNCVVHHGQPFVQRIQAAGAIIVYLPPYSPELNPVRWNVQVSVLCLALNAN